ncbi:MAG: LysR family transcriptional regulator [Coriobacteriia bacterium]|nr:LysR family transcriptional regulator [Coriobacteriia bacterium]
MDSKKLTLLMSAVREGSLRKAAKECGCTQSAVTQAMDSLEAELGFKVINRSHKGVTLTRAGELMYPLLVRLDEGFTELKNIASSIAADMSSPIRLGVASSVAQTWLVPALEAYKKNHEDSSFEIMVGSDSLSDWLRDGKADLVIGTKEQAGSFRWFPLMDEPCALVLPESFRTFKKSLTAAELSAVPILMAPRDVLDDEVAAQLNLLCCDDDTTLVSLVAQDQGAAIVPRSALRGAPAGVQVLEFDPPATRTIGLALPNSPRVEASYFADYLCDNMPYVDQKEETPEEKAMRASIRRALGGTSNRSWQSPVFK